MNDLKKKISKLEELIKGLKSNIQSSSVLPSIKQKKLQGIKTPSSTSMPGISPKGKKNPVKQAEQVKNADIKDMKMREARETLNVSKATGQWSIEPLAKPCGSDAKNEVKKEEKPKVAADTYHIHQSGKRITSKPLTLKEIHTEHGGVKKLEGAGFRLHRVKIKS